MRRSHFLSFLSFGAVCFLMWGGPASLQAQKFEGTGQQATDFFYLPQGLAVFELVHASQSGPFSATLMNEEGVMIGTLGSASDPSPTSSAVRIPHGGRYVFNVVATGPWAIELRGDGDSSEESAAFLAGEEAGRSAAAGLGSRGWFLRGLVGGAIAGPLGGGLAYGMASHSGVPETALPSGEPDYQSGFKAAFDERAHDRRKRAVLLGGTVGTGILLVVVLTRLHFGGSDNPGEGPPNPGGPVYLRIPG